MPVYSLDLTFLVKTHRDDVMTLSYSFLIHNGFYGLSTGLFLSVGLIKAFIITFP